MPVQRERTYVYSHCITPFLTEKQNISIWLVVSNMFYFPFHIWDVILPIDFHIFQMGRYTTNQLLYVIVRNITSCFFAAKSPHFEVRSYPFKKPALWALVGYPCLVGEAYHQCWLIFLLVPRILWLWSNSESEVDRIAHNSPHFLNCIIVTPKARNILCIYIIIYIYNDLFTIRAWFYFSHVFSIFLVLLSSMMASNIRSCLAADTQNQRRTAPKNSSAFAVARKWNPETWGFPRFWWAKLQDPHGSMVLVYMLTSRGYMNGKCYHIWQHHGSYGIASWKKYGDFMGQWNNASIFFTDFMVSSGHVKNHGKSSVSPKWGSGVSGFSSGQLGQVGWPKWVPRGIGIIVRGCSHTKSYISDDLNPAQHSCKHNIYNTYIYIIYIIVRFTYPNQVAIPRWLSSFGIPKALRLQHDIFSLNKTAIELKILNINNKSICFIPSGYLT